MRKTVVTMHQVAEDLEKVFEIEKGNNGSTRHDFKFMINKQHFERFLVIEMLQKYFNDKVILDGYLQVAGITFVFTTFEIKQGKPDNV